MQVHHIGCAVRELPESIESFTSIGYRLQSRSIDAARRVEIAFMRHQETLIELISPLKGKEGPSPVDAILEKNGPMPYHICYAVSDIAQTIQACKQKGWTLIIKPAPAPALEGALVAFLYHKAQGVIELAELREGQK